MPAAGVGRAKPPPRVRSTLLAEAIVESGDTLIGIELVLVLHIYSADMGQELVVHEVTWSRHDSFFADQYLDAQPEELPTAPVTTVIAQVEPPARHDGFAKFDFEGRL